MKKIILLIAFCVLILDTSFSQEVEWQNTIGGTIEDQLSVIKQTFDGGYILGGFSQSDSSGDKTENNIGNSCFDYWIVKINSSGNIQWQNNIGGSGHDYLTSIQQTNDGGYILGGTSGSDSSGDKTENNANWDYWIVKTDSAGDIQWQNTIGGNGGDWLKSLNQTSDGGYIIGGYSLSGISGDKTENNLDTIAPFSNDYWIVKTDSVGNVQWDNTIGGTNYDQLYCIKQTTDGGYILGGWSLSDSSGDKNENCSGWGDYWIVKTNSTGIIQWQRTIGGNDEDIPYSIVQTNNGGYIFGGVSYSDSSGNKTENSYGDLDYWIVKTDSAGNIQWDKTIGGNSGDELGSVQQTLDGGYIVGGNSQSNISGNKTENSNGFYDYWIVKIDASGNIQWQNTVGGSYGDYLYSSQQTADGGYILGGYSGSNISGDKTENCIGQDDYWIVKLTGKSNLITGKLFIDANMNGVPDAGELAVKHKAVTETNTGRFDFSQTGGIYYVNILDSGNFSVSPASINYYNPVPSSHNVYFSGIHQTDSLNDFAFQPAGVFNDLCVTITPMGSFNAGFDASYMLNYENVGTTTLNGTVIFFPDNDVTFVSSNPTATSVTTDSVVWNVGTLTPFQTGSILVTVNVNAGTPIGTLINSNARIEPVAGDNYPGCNYAYWEIYTTGAMDPNAIIVDRDTVLTTELSSPPYLNYIIYFQNTGNDTAFNARVLNNIPQRLDVNSFEFVASSHPMNITYGAHARLMTFTFDNIFLPDSNVNEPASHGFIRYRIKPKSTLVAGNKINNKAFIYFDFNQPVMTNTAVTEIVLQTGSPTLTLPEGEGIALYPNPATNLLTVFFTPPLRGGRVGLHIYDLYGREVYQFETLDFKPQTKINVSGFSQGVYFLNIKANGESWTRKIVKIGER